MINKKTIKLVILVLLLIGVVFGVLWYIRDDNTPPSSINAEKEGRKMYKNNALHFQIVFPEKWIVDERFMSSPHLITLKSEDNDTTQVLTTRQVSITPSEPDPLIQYITISFQDRSFYDVKSYFDEQRERMGTKIREETIVFAQQNGVVYSYEGTNHREVYISYDDTHVYGIITDSYHILDVKEALATFSLLP